MNRHSWTIFCLAYLVGLLSTSWLTFSNPEVAGESLFKVGIGLGGLTLISAWIVYRCTSIRLRKSFWLEVFIIAIVAVIYFQVRVPQPSVNDISNQLHKNKSQIVIVSGKVLTEPRLTSDEKAKLWLKTTEIEIEKNSKQEVTGKLYVTLPLLQATSLYPGKNIKIQGVLYKPQSPKNPGAFDFKKYLNYQGSFAGLKGWKIIEEKNQSESIWGWWKIRRRIVRSQVRGLGSPVGQLVSSITLGRKAVDLPEELGNNFIQVGLAHILAASGFHVALLLGLVLRITHHLSGRSQLMIGLIFLFIYICLTGLQPSVIRATLMGTFVLVALANNSQVKPLGSLLLAAIIILLFNPLWIWDLGFQLSFLATFGLIVTAPQLSRYLNWLPPTLATAIAIPLAASIWTLPLLSYVFNTVAVYSLIINILTTPFVTLISLGGMISAGIGLFLPWLGSLLSKIIYYPTIFLIEFTNFFVNLPGITIAIGKIPLIVLIAIYTILILLWLNKRWQNNWYLGLIIVVILLVFPISYRQLNLVKATVLSANQEQIIVIQDRGKIILVNSGEHKTIKYTVLPFLTTQGINQIDYAIAMNSFSDHNGWTEINNKLTIHNFLSNEKNSLETFKKTTKLISSPENITTKNFRIKLLNNQPILLELKTKQQTWLVINPTKTEDNIAIIKYLQENNLAHNQIIIICSGKKIELECLKELKPQIAIITTNEVEESTRQQLNSQHTQLYITGQDGAISWQPQSGFQTTLITETEKNTFL
ncbi:ComEC/Rec2-related protein [Stanieria cyanosphaera PCC 7437]|uniref:ComEC/Rec2-related protein n=1 Tax=Stanieria cyanosphaera (strain ATCC 29371 / PCC 7437) TaxID=111780 RepID=K9XNM8_STAC7|nr:ComEC/Rec2 family competence protein [Stanieria cyanosphaera]AFZ33641.1 ComEC/Rec2-related protein [Stanieria cyanosphaera PCC 7437]